LMTRPNICSGKVNKAMKKLPSWIPNFNAWMSAILLLLLVRGMKVVLREILTHINYDTFDLLSARSHIILYFLLLLSPIIAIAMAHNLLHLFLDLYVPDVQTPEVPKRKSFFPGLMSWWEGLYGWLAIIMMMILSTALGLMLFSPNYYLSELDKWWLGATSLFNPMMFIRLTCVAYLYQFEHLVRQHLIAVGAGKR
ncbi:MAG: hypothetical protein AAFQ41_16955, partial [Cyanobacteria bacterium J06623_7]